MWNQFSHHNKLDSACENTWIIFFVALEELCLIWETVLNRVNVIRVISAWDLRHQICGVCGDIPGRQDLTKDDIGCIMVKCTSYDFWRSSSDHKFSLFVSTAPILTILFQSVCDVSYTTLYRGVILNCWDAILRLFFLWQFLLYWIATAGEKDR